MRVRSLHAQNRAVDAAPSPAQRCAVALAGIAKDEIARGQWLAAPAVALASDRIDVQLTLWHGEAHALRSGTPVHVHLGASDASGTVAMLDGARPVAAGRAAHARSWCCSGRSAPGTATAWCCAMRRPARTLAGGQVLDPFAPVRYRRTPQRLAELQAPVAARAPRRG